MLFFHVAHSDGGTADKAIPRRNSLRSDLLNVGKNATDIAAGDGGYPRGL